jgi:lambda repressor-like predicted transcriptional regulator
MKDEQNNIIRNEIKAAIARSGMTLTAIVEEMNNRHTDDKTTTQNISNKLARQTIKYSEVLEIADIIGLKIEWTKK